jgi:hypothetical protein
MTMTRRLLRLPRSRERNQLRERGGGESAFLRLPKRWKMEITTPLSTVNREEYFEGLPIRTRMI